MWRCHSIVLWPAAFMLKEGFGYRTCLPHGSRKELRKRKGQSPNIFLKATWDDVNILTNYKKISLKGNLQTSNKIMNIVISVTMFCYYSERVHMCCKIKQIDNYTDIVEIPNIFSRERDAHGHIKFSYTWTFDEIN